MIKVYELINEIPLKELVSYIFSNKNISEEEATNLINKIKKVTPKEIDMSIAAMLVADDYTSANCNFHIEIIGYPEPLECCEFYDISHEKWEKVLGMGVSESSLANLLPVEVVGELLMLISETSDESPEDGTSVLLTSDIYNRTRKQIYNACDVKDDRSEFEKDLDRTLELIEFEKLTDLFYKYIRISD